MIIWKDVGGSVQEHQVREAFRIISEDSKVKAILVNVFGGIVNCATIANGVVNACRSIDLKLPLVVRLEGTNVDNAKKILAESGLPIQRYQWYYLPIKLFKYFIDTFESFQCYGLGWCSQKGSGCFEKLNGTKNMYLNEPWTPPPYFIILYVWERLKLS